MRTPCTALSAVLHFWLHFCGIFKNGKNAQGGRSIVLSSWPPEALKIAPPMVKTKTMDPKIHICCLFDIQLWHMIGFYHINYTNLIISRVRCRSSSRSCGSASDSSFFSTGSFVLMVRFLDEFAASPWPQAFVLGEPRRVFVVYSPTF